MEHIPEKQAANPEMARHWTIGTASIDTLALLDELERLHPGQAVVARDVIVSSLKGWEPSTAAAAA